jgi:hypothetical protein
LAAEEERKIKTEKEVAKEAEKKIQGGQEPREKGKEGVQQWAELSQWKCNESIITGP